MRRNVYSSVWVVAVLAVSHVAGAAAQAPGDKALSGTRQASCIVRITSDAESLPLTVEFIESLLSSSPVAGAAARELLGWDSGQLVSIGFSPLTQQGPPSQRNMIGRIDVELSDDLRPAAEEFLADLCKRLEAALGEVGDVDKRQGERRLQEVDAALRELNERIAALRDVRREIFDQAGRDNLSRAQAENITQSLEAQRQGMLLHLAGMNAREKALAEQIAKVGKQAAEAGKADAVAEELAKVVEIREKQLRKMELYVQSGQANEMEAANLEEQLAHARADLAKYREDVVRAAGGGILAELNQKLVDLTIETAETKATLAATEQQLDDIRSRHLLELADRYEREVEMPLHMCSEMSRDLTEEQFRLKEDMRGFNRPEVVVIGGE